VSKETALEAFALAIAPLPGVTPPTGSQPALYERMDGTFAIDWIVPYLDELTPDQKAVVDAALSPDANAPVVTPAPSGSSGVRIVLAADKPASYYAGLIASAQSVIAGKLGRSLHLGWSVTINATQGDSDATLAYTVMGIKPVQGVTGCTVHINPTLAAVTESAADSATMAHEIFHCFQSDWLDQHGGYRTIPDWIKEGQAEWVGETVGGPSTVGQNWWGTYLTTMDTALWQRTYDAVGFYLHLSEVGIDPWKHLDAMLAATSNSDAFKAAGATDDSFLDTWSSGLFRDSKLGAPWNTQALWQLQAKAQPHDVTVANGDIRDLSTNPVVNQDNTVTSSADVVEVRMQGHVRVHTAPDGDEVATTQRWLCTRSGGCTCPTGSHYAGPDLETVAPTFQLGLTGSLATSGGTLHGHALQEFCKPDKSQSPSTPCKTNCGHSNGDPHVRTVNSYIYDFQAAGEFVLLRSTDGSVEIQARQEPKLDSRIPGVSINTAVAARVNGHRVGVYAPTPNVQGASFVVRVDGAVVDPTSGADVGAGASLRAITGGVELDFPDGTVLWALTVAPYGFNAVVQPADALRANGGGLLGSIVPGGLGVPALPDGTRLPAAGDQQQRHQLVYGQFADAWRVTDASSLFDYDPGKSTLTYTDRNFPSDAQEQALASFPPDQAAAADVACAAITAPDLQPECIFDVEATGDPGFANSYAPEQDLYDSGIAPASPAPAASGGMNGAVKVTDLQDLTGAAVGPDSTLYVSIDDAAGKASILSVDPRTAKVIPQITVPAATTLHFATGSLWAAGLTREANGDNCTVTRFDPASMSTQATIALPCAPNQDGPQIVSTGTAAWFVDTTKVDLNTSNGAANLTRLDPSSNQPGQSVTLPLLDGCCQDSQGALFCYCGGGGEYRLLDTATAFENLGDYAAVFPAGIGFWTEQGFSAAYVNSPAGPAATVPLSDGWVVGGDPTGVYVQTSASDIKLLRKPADGSAAVQLATAPTIGTGIDQTYLDYLRGAFPWFATSSGYLHLWVQARALYLQWAPLP